MRSLYHDCARRVLADCESALAGGQRVPQRMTVGGFPKPLPSELVVRELPTSASISDPVTSAPAMGRSRSPMHVEFSVTVEVWSTRRDLVDSAEDVWSWFESCASAIASDRTLGGLVSHASVSYDTGASATRDAQYVSAIEFSVRCKAFIRPCAEVE